MSVRPRTARRSQSRQEERVHARERQRQRELRARRIRLGIVLAGVAAMAALLGVGIVASTRGLPGRSVALQGTDHIGKGVAHIAYNSTPPTSGPHWNIAGEGPVAWGIYDAPIPNEAQIHNLEHGGIMIQYNCSDCPELKQQLEDFYNRYVPTHRIPLFPNSSKIIVAPYPDMPSRVALTAWGRIDTLDAFDEERIIKFIEAFRDKGAPEAGRTP
ncbi:MAG: DUF3105 domain-containing protein [Chloroflexi bacterium]|nr:DUF3105 domain-containing protein [Chloroflexota bacterium]